MVSLGQLSCSRTPRLCGLGANKIDGLYGADTQKSWISQSRTKIFFEDEKEEVRKDYDTPRRILEA